jgi:adenine-specific DNA-methyltransferase
MQNLLNDLTNLLSQDKRLVSNGRLLKNKIIELTLKLDAGLIKKLLSHQKIKKYFFEHVDDVLVFDKIKFQKFINNKAFLPDSFTAFKNKIGLTVNDDYLSSNKEVVLSWPYKDCILEGGQRKEDTKRNEIFWNEVLAPDQIDRLLHPKAFTNFLKFSTHGKSAPQHLETSDNFIIRGNNLLALHSLKPIYANKIKLIYIDPPYNTGSDSFLYNDSFNHSTWLTFMKNRLEIAWELLSRDGSIFIQVDDTEFAYLKVLCDELFGRENFKENIILKSSTESGVNAINVKRGERLFKVKENILFYSKSPSFRFKPFYTKAEYNKNYKYEVIKEKGGYIVKDLSKEFFEKHFKSRKRKDISTFEMNSIEQELIAYALDNPQNIYSLEKNIKKAGAKFKNFAEKNKSKGIVEEYLNSSKEISLVYDGGVLVPLRERIVAENGRNYFGVLASDLWLDIGTTPSNEGGISFSNGKKPEKLLRRIIEMTTDENDIVLDYHLGSGSTAAVAHKLNRRYIGIEQLDYGENDSVVRLQNVIHGDQTGISKSIQWKGGGSFVYFELKKYNQIFINKITEAKNKNELTVLLGEILDNGFINYSADLNELKNDCKRLAELNLETQKKVLISLLDLNFLYVPYTEAEDKCYQLSPDEIRLNKEFYSLKIK